MSRRVIGLDAGGTKLLAGIVDEAGEVEERILRPWPANAGREEILTAFGLAIDELRDEADEIEAIGVGLPATLDLDKGIVAGCRHLPLVGFAFGEWLEEETDLPVHVDNDATLAMVAEHTQGAAAGALEAVMLTVGTGIGGGLVVGGQIVRGAHGSAGEPGHMSIDADGPPCPGDCPGRGCLEAFVSGPALVAMGLDYASRGPDYNLGRMLAEQGELTAADVVKAARMGDPGAAEAFERMGEKLGVGIASLLNLLDPEVVVVGGGLGSNAGDLLLTPAARVARERSLEPASSGARIVVAALGEDAGMVGAAQLALAEGEL